MRDSLYASTSLILPPPSLPDPFPRPSPSFSPSLLHLHSEQHRYRDRQHDQEKHEPQPDIPRDVRDEPDDGRAEERRRFVGKGEEGEEGGLVALLSVNAPVRKGKFHLDIPVG